MSDPSAMALLGALIEEESSLELALMQGEDGMLRWHVVKQLRGVVLPSFAPQPLTVKEACAVAGDADELRQRTRTACGDMRIRAKARGVSGQERRRLEDNVKLLREQLREAAA